MLGAYDFCGSYDWTFDWLWKNGGDAALHDYWVTAISRDSQRHARQLIGEHGFEGMESYWGHTLREEGAGYTTLLGDDAVGRKFFRLDMYDCPSKGFLIRNGLAFSQDYCDHCIGWIGPMLADAGFTVDHDHDHAAHCWWEIRRADDTSALSKRGELAGENDVRNLPLWKEAACNRFRRGDRNNGNSNNDHDHK